MPSDHWYDTATEEDRREYDAFGPWIYEVSSPEQLPPWARPFGFEPEPGHLLYKIPIEKDRRDCRPGQILYDHLVAFDGDHLVITSLVKGVPAIRQARPSQIVALRHHVALLRGEFRVLLDDGAEVGFSYNTVSRPLVEALADALRAVLPGRTAEGPGGIDAEVNDAAFETVVRRQKARRPGLVAAVCLEPGAECHDDRGRKRRSTGLLVLDGGGETLFVDAGPQPWKTKENQYATRITVVPHARWEGFAWDGRAATVRVGGQELVFPVFGDAKALVDHLNQISPMTSDPK